MLNCLAQTGPDDEATIGQVVRDVPVGFGHGGRMAKPKFKIVLVTAPDLTTARRLARAALEARLIACANLVPGIESHYRWQGRVEQSAEVLLMLKTSQSRLAALERLVLAKHPYDTPEFVVLNPVSGAKKYLAWWTECLQADD